MATTGIISLYLFSLFPTAGVLLRPLQTQYTRYHPGPVPAQYVIVLGGWHKSNTRIPLSSQLGRESLIRVVEGVIISRQNPGSKLILSGAPSANDPVSNAQMMANLATALGIPRDDILLEERPKDTAHEAKYIAEWVGKASCVLVTSAAHMKRAMHLFQAQGVEPIPAPVDFLLFDKIPFSLMPSAIALESSEKSLHEYLGSGWNWLQEKIYTP